MLGITDNLDLSLAREEAALLAALRANPQSVEHYRQLCELQMRRGRPRKAQLAIAQALKIAPRCAKVALQAADLYVSVGEWRRAVTHYRRAVALGCAQPEVLSSLARCQLAARQPEAATVTWQALCHSSPAHLQCHLVAAQIKRATGDLPGAAIAYNTALQFDPSCAEAWYGLSEIQPQAAAAVLQIPCDAGSRPNDAERSLLHFARGQTQASAGQVDEAFASFTAANAAATLQCTRQSGPYSPATLETANGAIRLLFPGALPPRSLADYGTLPIFIVGMPRSGSSLVEHILGSHRQVHTGGELSLLSELYDEFTERRGQPEPADLVRFPIDHALLDEMRERYIEHLFCLGLDATFVTDKFPGNFRLLGFAHALFPDSRFVHCRRAPLPTLWSIYSTPLSTPAPYRGSLSHLGHFFSQYRRQMAHWQRSIPMHEIHYERLVQDPEKEIRALVEACGLPWDPRCLSPHESRSYVTTASATQVRRPIYQSALERWRPFAPKLEVWLDEFSDPTSPT